MADANTATLRFVQETTWGTTPSSSLQALRITGESINDQEASTESAEIISDRQLRDVIRTGRWSAGEINFELADDTAIESLLQGALCGSWSSNVLENGTTKYSYTFEKEIAVDGSPSSHFITFPGSRLDTFALSFTPGSPITGSFGVMGKGGVSNATSAGSGTSAATTTEVVSGVDVTAITEASASPGDVVGFTLNTANNLRRQSVLGSSNPRGFGYGSFRANGTISLYFADRALYDKYIADTRTELEIAVQDASANSYTFTVPKARYGPPTQNIAGLNQDIQVTFPWTAILDAGSTGKMLYVTRS